MIKLALPGGPLRQHIAQVLQGAGIRVSGYAEGSRSYRFQWEGRAQVRVFRERDIPVQIALGQYDVGICSMAWVEEFLACHPGEGMVKLGALPGPPQVLYLMATPEVAQSWEDLVRLEHPIIATEFPHMAEALALAMRLPSYRILPVWGGAEVYPPEDASLAVALAPSDDVVRGLGLVPLWRIMDSPPALIVHRDSLRRKDIAWLLSALSSQVTGAPTELTWPPPLVGGRLRPCPPIAKRDVLRVALPDGHQQPHVLAALAEAGLKFPGYEEGQRRLAGPRAGIEAKVIRPQDMPQMVALGFFDVAFTGRDCVLEHLYRFPSSPVAIALDLGRAAFNMSAVVSADLPVGSIQEALGWWRGEGKPLIRIASEFVAIADHYARTRHFWRYQVIPTAGASEGFVPDDADLLIEGTETGRTLAENRLKAIDVLFRSTTCVIVRRDGGLTGRLEELREWLLGKLAPLAVESPVKI